MKDREDIPQATEVTLVSDRSHYIRNAMSNLFNQVGLRALLVAVVALVFLRRFLPTLVIVSTKIRLKTLPKNKLPETEKLVARIEGQIAQSLDYPQSMGRSIAHELST